MRILLFSNGINAPQSSYGKQAGFLCKIWQALGHEVAMLAHPGVSGGGITIDGVVTFPQSGGFYSQDSVARRAKQWKADVVVSLMDMFVLNPGLYPGVRHIPYYPVDTNRLRTIDHDVLKASWASVAFSQYGQQKAAEVGIDSAFVPLTVDTNLYHPIDRTECRRLLGLPEDAFIFGVVAANTEPWPTRKGWHELFEAFALFLQVNPQSNALLYCHTHATGNGDGGTHLPNLAAKYGIIERVKFTSPDMMVDGVDEPTLCAIYNSFDVLVSASKGEGFCLPLVEAQSCGIPVICGEWTALKENAYAGVLIPEKSVVRAYDGKSVDDLFTPGTPPAPLRAFDAVFPNCTLEPAVGFAQEGTYRYGVFPQALANAMQAYYSFTDEEREQHAVFARQSVLKYNPYEIAKQWQPLLEQWEKRIAREQQESIPARKRPDLNSDFAAAVIRAQETEADVVLVCPSYGERCGIAEYVGYQIWELFKHGKKAVVATTVAEALRIAKSVRSITSVIVHHEYSLFDEGNCRLCMGESLPVVLRQLKTFADDGLIHGVDIAIVQHTVSPLPMHDGINRLLTSSGVPLYATSYAGVNYLASTYGAKVGHCALGTWSIPTFEPTTNTPKLPIVDAKLSYENAVQFAINNPEVLIGHASDGGDLTPTEWADAQFVKLKELLENSCADDILVAPYPEFETIQKRPLIIGNFGMLGPQRDLTECAAVCKATGARYLGSHACDDKRWIEHVQKLFSEAGVPYTLLNDWPDDVEIMHRLSACDILFMPRQSAVYYSSASVLSAMNARRPIIVNSDPGYQDLQGVLIFADTTEETVAAVERLKDPAEYSKAVQKIEDYLARRNVADVLREAGLI